MNLERTIQLYGLINGETVPHVISEIIKINVGDEAIDPSEREPIHLLIDSGGGYMQDSFALLSAMESSKTPIYTYCYGYAMSSAIPPYLAGQRRYAGRHSTFMIHQPKEPIGDEKVYVVENRLEEVKRLMNNRIKYVSSRCGITPKNFHNKRHIDWFMDVHQAIDYGIVHEII
jgi:ATP-dependent Clp protease protease subunit